MTILLRSTIFININRKS